MLCLPVPRSSQRVWLDSGAEESQLPSACFSKPADTVLVSPVLPSISDVTSAVPGMDADSRMENPDALFARAMADFEADPNLVALTARLKVYPELETFADRVIFGSDCPHIEGMPLPLDYAEELDGFPADVRDAVLRDNTVELNQLRPA